MATFALQIELLSDTSAAGQKPSWLLNQSPSSILVLDVRCHPEPAHVTLYQLDGWMAHQLRDAWQ